MKITWRSILPVCLSAIMIQPVFTYASTTGTSFASGEHVTLGDRINLYFSDDDPGKIASPLHLPNGLALTYGEILSLGDFYEIPDQPISQGQSEAEQRALFLASFSSFSYNPSSLNETLAILAVIHDEIKTVDDGMKNGEKPEDIFKKIGHENDRRFNCITGGGCSPSTWWLEPGRYLNLANVDYDHFGDAAVSTYKIGHQIALEQAVTAHQTGDPAKLEIAYAMNAFASHFLSDRFAAGHIRTPRLELSEQVTTGTIGSLLSNYMHGEENAYGLHVHNGRGDRWIAYGDKSYFSPQSAEHRRIIHETLQASADEVFSAYQTGSIPTDSRVDDLIPLPDETANAANLDISALFYWDPYTKSLMRRETMSNFYDRHWTNNWWGWSTLLELQRERGLTDDMQAILAKSELRKQALNDGLITNKVFIDYIRKH
ncbi:hypothetical protein AQUSIP_18230 [Aquicella siphonis]|uniref:Phospholipase C n=1 Tax=Aquicella siphonis TaxID=254247 RepID=A0A5E4PHK7_9COXI|nr:phospholipase [Aquicella siphonis]VVC76510.1 hypothetical protein AQUSIP_18230 [Aquicella siphonis]